MAITHNSYITPDFDDDIGRAAEHIVLGRLTWLFGTAVAQVSPRQKGHDALLQCGFGLRPVLIQTKGTMRKLKGNNRISNLDREFDFLAAVLFGSDFDQYSCYVMTKQECEAAYTGGAPGFPMIVKERGRPAQINPNIANCKSEWGKIARFRDAVRESMTQPNQALVGHHDLLSGRKTKTGALPGNRVVARTNKGNGIVFAPR